MQDFLNQNDREAVEFMKKFQELGYAVVVITPEELGNVNPREIEDRLIAEAVDALDFFTEENDQ